MRTKDVEDVVGQALDSLFSQSFVDFELRVVDSGSTDGTLDVVSRFPARIRQIPAEAYVPGRVLNAAIESCSSPIIVFQNSDVVPLAHGALAALVAPFDDHQVDAAFGRQVPRPDAHTWVRNDYARAFPASGPAPEWLPYSLPFAAMRRTAWERRPFYDGAWGSEDTEWGVYARRTGRRVAYVPEALVMHSHNYTLRQLYGRRFIEGEADAFIYGNGGRVATTVRRCVASIARDVHDHARAFDLGGLLLTPARRAVDHWAYWRGHGHGRHRIRVGDRDVGFGRRVVLERRGVGA